MLNYILKIVKNIDGSETIEQLEVSRKMMENFFTVEKPTDDRIINDLRNYYNKKLKEFKSEIV